jgi:hypothetical protein
MNKQLRENEIRQLLSRAWRRRRPQVYPSDIRNALHLNLNSQLEEESRGDVLTYFFAVLVVGALLYLVYSRIEVS